MVITFRGVELNVCFTHHPEQEIGPETEPIIECVEIEEVYWRDTDISDLFIEGWQDIEELAHDVLQQLKEER